MQLPGGLTSLSSPAGSARALASGLATEPANAIKFWNLFRHFETQHTQSFCSIATAAMLLNALRIPRPVDPAFAPYGYFTQANVLGECALAKPSHDPEHPLSVSFIATHGATLDEWAGYLSCWATTRVVHASNSSVDAFRSQARAALDSEPAGSGASDLAYIGINFHRTALGQVGGGHMSPLAAYDARADRFLLLDVSRYKYPAYWVPTEALFAAMNTTDSTAGASRGWVVVSRQSECWRATCWEAEVPAINDTAAPPALPPHDKWPAIKACVGSLEPTDGHGVIACFADPSRRLAPPWPPPPPPSGVGAALVAMLCVLCAALGACLALCCQRWYAAGRAAQRGGRERLEEASGTSKVGVLETVESPAEL